MSERLGSEDKYPNDKIDVLDFAKPKPKVSQFGAGQGEGAGGPEHKAIVVDLEDRQRGSK